MKPTQGGYSLIELMVAVAIGLLALVFATSLVGNAERSKSAQLGGSDSLQNAMVAMFSLSRDAEQAGWGLNDTLLNGCDTAFGDSQGYALPSQTFTSSGGATSSVTPLAPILITDNGNRPDSITFQSGTNLAGTAMLRLVAAYSGGTTLNIDRNPYGFAVGDVIAIMPETRGAARCAIGQISSLVTPPAPGQNQIVMNTGGSNRFNQAGGLGVNYTANQARMFNLGSAATLRFHTWTVSNGLLQLRATEIQGATSSAVTVTDNIVGLKAQYGFDVRTGAAFAPESGMQIGQWSGSLIDADGDGAIDGNDIQRIAAVRLAVVARGPIPERAASCTTTTSTPTVFSSALPQGVTAVPVALDVRVSGDSVDWRCYRYKTLETIIPLRNASWRPAS